MDSQIPPKLKAFFVREYSRQAPSKTLAEPVFVTHKRRATVFLGWRSRDNLKRCRHFKNKGYTLTLRRKRIPAFQFRDSLTQEVLTFTWSGRDQTCFGGAWWN